MPGNFLHRRLRRNMTKHKPLSGQMGGVAATEVHRAGIMIAFDPDPVTPGLQARNPEGLGLWQRGCRGGVIKAVAKADHRSGRCRLDITLKLFQRFTDLIRRDQRASPAGDPLAFAEMQVGNAEQRLRRPVQRSRPKSAKRGTTKFKRNTVHASFMSFVHRKRKLIPVVRL